MPDKGVDSEKKTTLNSNCQQKQHTFSSDNKTAPVWRTKD
jgi:hypothetical protein